MAESVTVVMSGIRGGVIFPRAVFNGSLDINLYFTDLNGNYQSWSGGAGYTPSIKIRQPKGFTPENGVDGTVAITDGLTTRSIYFDSTFASYTLFGNSQIAGVDGFYGGYNGIAAGNRWVFNGGTGGAGLSAAAVWAGVRIKLASDTTNTQTGTLAFQATSAGAQAALSVGTNALLPATDVQLDKLITGSATAYERWLLRISKKPYVTVSSFAQIANGWSCTIPFTDTRFLTDSGGSTTIAEYADYDVEILVTKNSDSSVTALVSAKIRVFRKQISLVL